MTPAAVFAFATSSSAATIPITLKQTKKIVGSDETESFVVPLCANLHIPGLNIHVVLCAMALMLTTGMEIDLFTFIAFVLMLAVTCVAAPGIPGGLGFLAGDASNMPIALYSDGRTYHGLQCHVRRSRSDYD